ncbi:MAG: xylulokinase, partial [Clostridia bacterium]|nr:xylulokinase [Clostridia bacterium]
MRYLLGIDVGTTGTKSILFSEDGAHMKSAYKAYPAFEPSANAREQDANDLWDAVCETSKKVCEGHGEEVAALSLSTQGGTLIPTDARFEPVRR